MVASAVVFPLLAEPTTISPPSSARSTTAGSCRWRSGSSATPKGTGHRSGPIATSRPGCRACTSLNDTSSGSGGRTGDRTPDPRSAAAASSTAASSASSSVAAVPSLGAVATGSPARRWSGSSATTDSARCAWARRGRTGPRGLEADRRRWASPNEATPADRRRNRRRVANPDHTARLVSVEHAERYPQVDVGQDALVDRPAGALRCEHQVDAEATAPLGDVDDAVDELRDLGDQGGELVDDDHQRRRSAVGIDAPERSEVGRPSFEHAHAPVQLRSERDERPLGQPPIEIGDRAHRVGGGSETARWTRRPCSRRRAGSPATVGCRRPGRRPAPRGARSSRSHSYHRSTRAARRPPGPR